MKILFILPWVPYPLHSGGNQAFYNMVDALRQEHQITVTPYCYNSNDVKAAKELQKRWDNVSVDYYSPTDNDNSKDIPKDAPISWIDKVKLKFFTYLEQSMQRKQGRINRKYIHKVASTEFSLGKFVKENSTLFSKYEGLTTDFLKFIYEKSRTGYDLIQVEFYECLPLVYILPENVRKVFVHHELRFIRNMNEVSLFDNLTLTDKIKLQQERDLELSALSHYDDIIVLTETDKNILQSYFPKARIYVSPALTNTSEATTTIRFKEGKDLVFIGGGDHFPNADGMLWFAMEIMPILNQSGFSGKVYIVGKWGAVRNIIHKICPEIIFAGFVEDLYSFINGKITIVPIRIGSGMRMKILDATAALSPMVTTSKGCEGLPLCHNEDCCIADDARTFAESILNIQKDANLQNRLAANAASKLHGINDSSKILATRLNFYR